MTKGIKERIEERKQEGIDEGYHEKELEATVPAPKTRALHSEFALAEAVGHLDLPATSIGQHKAPGVIMRVDRLIGNQVPRGAALARARDDQPER